MSSSQNPLTTHVLDTARGCAASNLPLTVFKLIDGQWSNLTVNRSTNDDGRCPGLLTADQFTKGTYKITFETGVYFEAQQTKGFYPYVDVVFEIEKPEEHYHVPLLLSPFGYSTYRGT